MTKVDSSLAGKYFLEKADEVRFLDPVLGVELKADEPSPSLLQDKLAAKGIEQLHRLAAEQRLTVQLIQAAHGGVEDFYDMVQVSGAVLDQATMVGVETDWKLTTSNGELPTLSALEYVFAEYPGRQAFQKEQIAWLSSRHKTILPCEYPDNYNSPFFHQFMDAVQLCWQLKDQGDARTSTILFGAYQTVRQWTFLAQLGYWLGCLEESGKLPAGQMKIPFMSGQHRSIAAKLNSYFGIPTELYIVAERTLGPLGDGTYETIFDDMTAHARITHEQLKQDFWGNV